MLPSACGNGGAQEGKYVSLEEMDTKIYPKVSRKFLTSNPSHSPRGSWFACKKGIVHQKMTSATTFPLDIDYLTLV